ncbi:FHA domain-containing protein [Pseudoteredinibacter isoporae]|uniref:FHA domain-containing protein n=1 Tax=Pseudoteredinibacter isoporae TaxID=570281 RepID=A0A7X0JQ51_9GAMM|nr:FHA domain-containing protein [Pseudoteredinibacter isoporae]MBB6520242.1 hypothetical protein [Pseudoteredinibacter isoporae]NHO85814.1 FHA domain-containing protein [Pseudoteredinibacter isoporae]NIB25734.1 FHA domain-containing protein [Pseudoteredinibacter isoporae]
MASLINVQSKQLCHLLPHHTFGRREDKVDTFLDAPQISKIHASIEWDGCQWLLKDISRNGVWVDGKKIESQQNYPIQAGQLIQFVSKELRFLVEDTSAPDSYIVPQHSRDGAIPMRELMLLPDDENPKLALHLSPDNHQWLLESLDESHEVKELKHGDEISLGDLRWVLHLTDKSNSPTVVIDADWSVDNFLFRFNTTQDEENTSLALSNGSNQCDLGERSHHYVLLHLARCRAIDEAKGIGEYDQGWIDNNLLCREMGMDLAHINIQLYRLRKQLSDAMPDLIGINKLVERKRGKLRFGRAPFQIFKSGELLTELKRAV